MPHCGQQTVGNPAPPAIQLMRPQQGVFVAGCYLGCAKPPHFARKKGPSPFAPQGSVHQGEGRGVRTPQGPAGTLGSSGSCAWLHWGRRVYVLIQARTVQGWEGTLICVSCSRAKACALQGASKEASQTWKMGYCFLIIRINLTPSRHGSIRE